MTSSRTTDLYLVSSGILPEERLLMASAQSLGIKVEHKLDTDLCAGGQGGLTRGSPVLLRVPSYFRGCVLASWLEERGHRVVNSLEAISRFGIKSRTDDWLKTRGIPTIPTRICFGPAQLAAAAAELGYPLVVKPDIGGFGTRVHRVRDESELRQLSEYVFAFAPTHIRYVYAQTHLDVLHDLRVFTIDGSVVAVMDRIREGALAKNVAQGGQGRPYALEPPESEVVKSLCDCMPKGYFGVDLLVTPGGPFICEINATCRFSELMKTSNVDVAEAIVRALLRGVA